MSQGTCSIFILMLSLVFSIFNYNQYGPLFSLIKMYFSNYYEIKYVILVEYLTVSATGHLQLKKNLGKKQRKNESTLTNITKAPM